MDQSEYSVFAQQVSDAVSDHPEYLSSLDSLKAAGANLKVQNQTYYLKLD